MMSLFLIDPSSTLVPLWWWVVTAFGFGVIIGSFLNVLIYRFHTGKSLSGHSHCLSCGTRLCWFELLPLVSYLGLRGRCRTCGCRIPNRYFLVEFATGMAFVGAVVQANRPPTVIAQVAPGAAGDPAAEVGPAETITNAGAAQRMVSDLLGRAATPTGFRCSTMASAT